MNPSHPSCSPSCPSAIWLLCMTLGCGTEPASPSADSETDADPTGMEASGDGTQGSADATSGASASDDGTDDAMDSTGEDSSNDSTGDVEEPPIGFPAFIAQGHMGRTMLSCDDGHTWIANQSLDDGVRCFEGLDCDHHEGSGTSLSAGGETTLVATWGWGTEGRIMTSTDGVEWTEVLVGPTFSGTAFGNDVVIAGARVPWRASMTADDWVELPDSGLDDWNARGMAFLPFDDGLFIIGGGDDLVLTANEGDDWWHPDAIPTGCGNSIRGITYGAGAIVIARGANDAADLCVSTDGGQQFQAIDLPEAPSGPPMWTGAELVVFSSQTRFTSPDGVNWEAQAISPAEVRLGEIARSPDGTYVAHRAGWMVWYEQQQMYRSDDGLTWEVLPEGAFVPSHPIRNITFGYVQPHSDGCG